MSGLLRRALVGLSLSLFLMAGVSPAQDSATTPSTQPMSAPGTVVVDTSVLHRLADLEAYVNNTQRVDNESSRIKGPGPGHNTWLMISAALVLFMTLPGLALFFGWLVRGKNVLSILAQCMGIAGIVTLLCRGRRGAGRHGRGRVRHAPAPGAAPQRRTRDRRSGLPRPRRARLAPRGELMRPSPGTRPGGAQASWTIPMISASRPPSPLRLASGRASGRSPSPRSSTSLARIGSAS